ncbi:MAG: pantetheine-phosphate adenylyltransferase [Eubacteriales bacterium]|nr:pantetheine-phosphate adenylyltransferase [Eubacteriales bacterium]
MKTGVYPGSFDPFTTGHMDIVRRACSMLDCVVVAVLNNSAKTPFFTLEERLTFIRDALAAEGIQNAKVGSFDGLLVEYARSIGAKFVVRGLRAVTDFEYEFQINAMNCKLAPEIQTVFFMAEADHAYLSSSIVKEIGALGGPIDTLVPDVNKSRIAERLNAK